MREKLLFLILLVYSCRGRDFCTKQNASYSGAFSLVINLDDLLQEVNDTVLIKTTREFEGKVQEVYLSNFFSETLQSFIFPPYSLLPGQYSLYLTGSHILFDCVWFVKPLPLLALIHGGTYRSVEANKTLVLESDVGKNEILSNVKFKWSCQSENNYFCKDNQIVSNRSTLTIPANFLERNQQLNVTVEIIGPYNLAVFTQHISVESGPVLELSIRCKLNCLPFTRISRIRQKTILKSECLNCFAKKINWTWIIYEYSSMKEISFEENAIMGQTDEQLIIGENVFQPGNYLVSVFANDVSRANFNLIFEEYPNIGKCLIKPEVGLALKTKFYLNCTLKSNERRRLYFELFSEEYARGHFLLTGTLETLTNQSFILVKSSTKLKVRICTIAKSCREITLNVPILIENDNNNRTRRSIIFDSFSKLLTNKKDLQLLTKFNDLNMRDLKRTVFAVNAIPRQFCYNLVKIFSTFFDNQLYLISVDNAKEMQKVSYECIKKSVFIRPRNNEHIPEEMFSLETFFNLTMGKAKALASTMQPVEIKEIADTDYIIYIKKDFDSNISGWSIKRQQCEISVKFQNSGKNMLVLILIHNYESDIPELECKHNDMFCYQPTGVRFGLSIVNQTKNMPSIDAFETSIKFSLTNFSLIMHNESLVVPESYDIREYQELENHIQTYKFVMKAHQSIYLRMHDLDEAYFFRVVIMHSKYPALNDFDSVSKDDVVSRMDPYEIYVNSNDEDKVGYIGIIAKRHEGYDDMVMNYNLSVVGLSCLSFEMQDGNFKLDTLEPVDIELNNQASLKTISCQYNNTGGIYAMRAENILFHKSSVRLSSYVLELESHFVIFIVAASLLFIYCVVVVFTAMRMPRDLYYLSDNSQFDRYCYLIMVRTANSRNAGTTSNVMIKIYGSKGMSNAHVLNYPDPEMRMLQRDGEDVFVLATKRHLGNIQKIDVWFNCTGPSPQWICKRIMVYDMQLRTNWDFRINQRYSVVEGGQIFRTFVPSSVSTSKKKTFCEQIKVFNVFHTWHFTNQDQENFSNMKRLTIVVSNVMSIQALDLMIHGLPSLQLGDAIDYYTSFKLDYFAVYSGVFSALLSFCVHISIAWAFRFSKIKFARYEQESVPLPYKVTVICWCVLSGIILCSTTLLITFGFWVPYYTSLIWLVSSTIAVANDVLIYENLFILVRSKVAETALFNEIEQHYDQILRAIETERLMLHQALGGTLLRPYMEHMYKKMSPYELKEKRVLVQQRRNIVTELEDMAMFSIYIIILFVSIFTNRAPFTVVVKDSLSDVMGGVHTRDSLLDEVSNQTMFHDYLTNTLIEVIHPTEWYMNYKLTEDGQIIDGNTKFLGIVRIRQHRMQPDVCTVPDNMKFCNLSCTPEYTEQFEERRNFFGSWKSPFAGTFNITNNPLLNPETNDPNQPNNRQEDEEEDSPFGMWGFQSSARAQTERDIGEITTYPGSGYIAPLTRSREQTEKVLNDLKSLEWFDEFTRCVIIEFLSYNCNYNIFSAVKVLIEFSATGFIHKSIQVQSGKMLYMVHDLERVSGIIFSIYIFWVSVVFFKQAVVLVKKFNSFFKNIWFMMDLSLNIVSICSISLFFIRMLLIRNYLEELDATRNNSYVSYATLFLYENIMTILQAFLVTVGTIRLWRYLRFGNIFLIMERTLVLASHGLWGAALAFGLVLIAFGLCGIMIFGNDFKEFYSMIDITRTLITMCLKPDQFQITSFIETDIAYAYFSCYLILMQINMNIFVVVIVIAYDKAQLEFSSMKDTYNIKFFLQDQMKLMPKLFRYRFMRLRGGQDSTDDTTERRQWVSPKSDEFFYANSVSTELRTMRAMYATVKNCLRNTNDYRAPSSLSDHEMQNMLRTAVFVIDVKRNDDITVFYKGRIEGQPLQLVDEKKIDVVAQAAQIILAQVNEHHEDLTEELDKADQDYEKMINISNIIRGNKDILAKSSLRLAVLINLLAKANLELN